MANIQDAIKQAQTAAADMVAEDEAAGTQVIEASASPAGVVTTFAKPSMATVSASTGVIPRSTPFLKVNEDGIKIGKDKTYHQGFKAKIDMTEDQGFQVKMTLRFGSPAQYISTYDGSIADKGGSWPDAIRKARMANPNCEPYHSVDVVLTLTEEVKLKDEVLPVGYKIGWNSSKTNFSDWSDFYAAVAKAGGIGAEVDAQIGFREINHNGNTWGVLTFEAL